MKSKLILFDWGNIVESHTTGYTCYDALYDLFKVCGYTGGKKVFENLGKYKLSCVSTVDDFEDVYNQMASDFKLKASFAEFIKLYKEIFDKVDYYKDVSEYEKSLKDKCYIGILSNLTLFDKERLDKQVDLSQYDYVFLSFEMNCSKPNREIYQKINEKVSFDSKDILFVDDRQDNVDMAKQFGWNALRATGLELEKIKECCENFIEENRVN